MSDSDSISDLDPASNVKAALNSACTSSDSTFDDLPIAVGKIASNLQPWESSKTENDHENDDAGVTGRLLSSSGLAEQGFSDFPWWKGGVIYQIYPRSFQDSNGDGIGDIRGIINRLDYLSETLAVDALWLSPIQPSPQRDYGYDQSDYVGVDPMFGNLDDFKELVDKCHARGLKVVMDGVFNHTSDMHSWFQESRSSRDNPKRNWYIWHDGPTPPNNWVSMFGGASWAKDPITESYYLHSFLPSQPDLNWREPEVVEAILNVLRHWLDLGVDGFRLDVFNCYYKTTQLLSNPLRTDPFGLACRVFFPLCGQHNINNRDQPEIFEALARMRAVVDEKPGRMMIGETLDERFLYHNAPQYVGPKKLHMVFNFRLLHSKWGARPFGKAIREWVGMLEHLGEDGWPSWVVSNHDMPRHGSRWKYTGRKKAQRDRERMRLVGLMLCTLRGTPCMYYGEELGMVESSIPRNELRDPVGVQYWPFHKGRDGCRTPMQWDSSLNSGFSEGLPWMRVDGTHVKRNVKVHQPSPNSVLSGYASAIALRKQHRILREGSMEFPPREHKQILLWYRTLNRERFLVALNMSTSKASLAQAVFNAPKGIACCTCDSTGVGSESYELLHSTHRPCSTSESGSTDTMVLQPLEGVVLRMYA